MAGGGDPRQFAQMMYNKFAELVDLQREELYDGLNGIYGNVSLDWIEAMTRIQNPKTRALLEKMDRKIKLLEKTDLADKEDLIAEIRELMDRLDDLRDREALQDAAFLAKLNTDIPNAYIISDMSNPAKRGEAFEPALYFGAHAQQGAEMGIKMPSTRLQRSLAVMRIPIALGKKKGPKTQTVFSQDTEYDEPPTAPPRDYPERSLSTTPPDEEPPSEGEKKK